jgi:hypothetical protein
MANKILDKLRLESNDDRSNLGDQLIRAVNALGSIGFGFTIGAVAMSWIPLPAIWQELFGALLVGIVFDFMLVVWESRTELQNGSNRQTKISKNAVTVSLWASTVASVAFLILQVLPFIFQNPADGQYLADLSFNVRLILSLATGGVMAFQFVQNSNWLREKPQRQRDRNKAEAYSTLSDEMTNIESEILDEIPDEMRRETQAYVKDIVSGMAKKKAAEIVREMGYGELVDGAKKGPTNADLQAMITQLQAEIKLGNGSAAGPNLVDLWTPELAPNGNGSGPAGD